MYQIRETSNHRLWARLCQKCDVSSVSYPHRFEFQDQAVQRTVSNLGDVVAELAVLCDVCVVVVMLLHGGSLEVLTDLQEGLLDQTIRGVNPHAECLIRGRPN